MLPSNLFSPYVPAVPSMPLSQSMAPSPMLRQYIANMPVPQQPQTAPQSPYLTPLNNNNSLDQLNLSRTVVLKNIDKEVSLNQLLGEIDHGPIEYCKMFERPAPKHITDCDTVKYCYISFINSKVSICFHLKYSKSNYNLTKLKERLNDSKHLKISLNETYQNQGGIGGRSTNKQDYIKLKTLNYIMEFNATRCVLIKFDVSPAFSENDSEFITLKTHVKETCSKYGEVEDYKVTFNKEKREVKATVHFTSIDAAIKTYEYFLKRILVEKMDSDHDDVDLVVDAKVTAINFHKDRCDRTDLEKRPQSSIPRSMMSETSLSSNSPHPLREEVTINDETKNVTSEDSVQNADTTLLESVGPVDGDLTFEDSQDIHISPPGSPIFRNEGVILTPQSTAASETHLYNRNPVRTHGSAPFPYNPDPFNIGNRTIYLGNLHPSSTIEEIANNVRAGGLVESINYRPEKRVCFITFVDPNIALKFYLNHQVLHQLIIHGYDITVGWAKNHSGPLSREVSLAVTAGASRNVYIGFKLKRDDMDPTLSTKIDPENQVPLPSEEQLRADFSKFGDLEQINFYHNRDCGFLNFLNIIDAIHLVEMFEAQDIEKINSIAQDEGQFYERYGKFKISFAKDRCGNPPKFSYKKRSRRRERIDFTYNGEELPIIGERSSRAGNEIFRENGIDISESNQKIPKEAAMVFGITSKDSDSEKETFNEPDLPAVKGLLLGGKSSDEKGVDSTVQALEGDSKHDGQAVKEHKSTIEEDEKAYEEEEDDEEEEEDDDVSIIIGSDDTASTTANNSNKEDAKRSSHFKNKTNTNVRKPYRNLSSSSLNSQGHYHKPYEPHYSKFPPAPYHHQQPHHYYMPPQGPPRMNYGYYPPTPAPMPPQYPQYPASRGQYSSSGSQVMAQYLAKAQHDNLLYAASVLSHDYDFEGDYNYGR